MRINNWNGGLFTRRDSTLIPINTGVIYHNINPEAEVLKSEYSPTQLQDPVSGVWSVEGYGQIVSTTYPTSFVRYKERVFYVDSNGNLVSKANGTLTTVGITPPDTKATVLKEKISPTSLIQAGDFELTIDNYSSALLAIPETFEGIYRYTYTYYDSSTGTESRPAPLSDDIQVDQEDSIPDTLGLVNAVRIDVIRPTQGTVDKIRIYRVGGNLTSFSMVAEIDAYSANLIPGNVTTPSIASIHDLATDFQVAGNRVLDSYSNYPPPKNIKYLTLHNAILFGAIEDKLYFSGIGDPHSWDIYNSIDFDDTITGIGSTAHGLLVFTEYRTYIVTGTTPATLAKHILNNEQGCINHYTISNLDNSLVWLSTDGICMSNGGNITVFTMPYLGKFTPTSINAEAHDRMYILSCEEYIYIIDFRYSPCIRTLDPIGVPIWVYKDEFVYVDSSTGNLIKLFTKSQSFRELIFKSGVIGFDGVTGYKTLKDVYIAYEGAFRVTMYAYTEHDKVLLLDANISSPIRAVEQLKTRGVYMSYSIEYEIKGTGIVYEIDIKGVTRNAD